MVQFGLSFAAPGVPVCLVAVTLDVWWKYAHANSANCIYCMCSNAHMWVLEDTLVCVCMHTCVCSCVHALATYIGTI